METEIFYKFGQRVGSTVQAATFLVDNYLSVKVLIATLLMNRDFNSTRCFHHRVGFTKGKIALFESTSNEPILKELESIEDDYSQPTTDTITKMVHY